jgi:hypothetical protein
LINTDLDLTCTVLPRPISSAKIPFKLLLYNETSQRKPFSWYLKHSKKVTNQQMSYDQISNRNKTSTIRIFG